jgi:hypothetical protein
MTNSIRTLYYTQYHKSNEIDNIPKPHLERPSEFISSAACRYITLSLSAEKVENNKVTLSI